MRRVTRYDVVYADPPFSKPPVRRVTGSFRIVPAPDVSKPPVRRVTSSLMRTRCSRFSKPPVRRVTNQIYNINERFQSLIGTVDQDPFGSTRAACAAGHSPVVALPIDFSKPPVRQIVVLHLLYR